MDSLHSCSAVFGILQVDMVNFTENVFPFSICDVGNYSKETMKLLPDYMKARP